MMRKSRILLYVLLIGVLLLIAACSPDRQLGFQAVLTDPTGIPVPDGDYEVTVRIWSHPTASTGVGVRLVLQDTQTVPVTDGFLNLAIPALLADAHALNPAEYAQPLWAEFEIEGEKLLPRQKLLATPLAFSLVGGAAVAINENTALPLIDKHPEQGALNVMNAHLGTGPELKGSTGLVVSIVSDNELAEVIRACAGATTAGTGCADEDLVFRVFGDGDVTAKGTFSGGGADFAEWILLQGQAEPGDVLVISPVQDRAVTLSSSANNTALAGVYSTDPGFIGGSALQDQPGMIPVAITGIVPVKVTAANGPILRGDLLATSDLPGYAMLATEPQFGSILGRAMGELLEGESVIDVLLVLK